MKLLRTFALVCFTTSSMITLPVIASESTTHEARTPGQKLDDAIDKTKEKAKETKEKAKEKKEETKEKAREKKEELKEKAKEKIDKA